MFGSVPGLPESKVESAGPGTAVVGSTPGYWRESPSWSLALPGSPWVSHDPATGGV